MGSRNQAPIAVVDDYNVQQGGTLDVVLPTGGLANDTDPENDALSSVLVSGPSFATS